MNAKLDSNVISCPKQVIGLSAAIERLGPPEFKRAGPA
ncbi:MAG: hypothetical protein ACI9WS_002981, partial [Paraglaciecola psychrophila]